MTCLYSTKKKGAKDEWLVQVMLPIKIKNKKDKRLGLYTLTVFFVGECRILFEVSK